MNRRPCEHLGHYERNGTYLRVLLAVPADQDADEHAVMVGTAEDGICVGTTRIVILTAPTLHGLDNHTARLQTAAAEVDWELRPADGLHRRIIERLRQHNTTEVDR
jgi:hypothetical protein